MFQSGKGLTNPCSREAMVNKVSQFGFLLLLQHISLREPTAAGLAKNRGQRSRASFGVENPALCVEFY
jgi:hypothetical protein